MITAAETIEINNSLNVTAKIQRLEIGTISPHFRALKTFSRNIFIDLTFFRRNWGHSHSS
jgi:hypothetical protein